MSRIISENENPITLTLGQVREKIREIVDKVIRPKQIVLIEAKNFQVKISPFLQKRGLTVFYFQKN